MGALIPDPFLCPKPLDATLTFHGHWVTVMPVNPQFGQWASCAGCQAQIRWAGTAAHGWMAINNFYKIEEEP